MLTIGPAQKVTIHVNADVSSRVTFLHDDILQFLLKRGVAGATLLPVQAGFGAHHRMHTQGAAGIEGEHLSVRIEFIENKESVDAILPDLCELVSDGLIEIQPTTILKVTTGKENLL
jgi:PII-like signaling protein